MRSPLFNLIRPLAINVLNPLLHRMQPIPLIKRRLEIKLPHRQRQHHAQLQHHQPLPDAIPRSKLKRPPGALDGVQRVFGPHEPALREEVVGSWPVGGIAV